MISAALSWTRARSSGVIRSSTGVMTGWSATMRGSPSTIAVSLPKARRPSLLCAFATLRLEPAQLLGVGEALHPARDVVQVEPREPDVDVAHPGEVAHGLAVRAHYRPVDDLALLGVEPAVAAGDREARHEPLDVPLERPGQRLVEVVDV